MTVRQLLDNIDSRELSEWMAYFKVSQDKEAVPLEDKVVAVVTKAGAKYGDSRQSGN